MANEYRHLNSPHGAAEIDVENKAFHSGFSRIVKFIIFPFLYLPRVPLDIAFQTVFENRLRNHFRLCLLSDSPNCLCVACHTR